MIHIDFQGGAHGNYLEFVCNKFLANVQCAETPFNALGASHNKLYSSPQQFFAKHYSYEPVPLIYNKIITIKIEHTDLLPLSQISLLRAGDYGYDNNQMEFNTYNKLNNIHYRWVLDKIINGFFKDQVTNSYNAIKDTSWPSVATLADFNQLPDHIRAECLEQHQLVLLELSSEQPDCPRSVLREFFEIGFCYPENSGFMTRQRLAVYDDSAQVYTFPFSCFYQKDQFMHEIDQVAQWAGFVYNQDSVAALHDKFLDRQPYKDSKTKCDKIVAQLMEDPAIILPDVDLLEEAYINAKLGTGYFT
jgi:hypothetical protein